MSWVRKHPGLDAVDLVIQAAVTGAVLGFVAISGAPTEVLPLVLGASFALLGVRRHFALRAANRPGLTSGEMAAERIAEMEQRMAELEAVQPRIAELEERLDFTERLLAQSGEQRSLGSGGAR